METEPGSPTPYGALITEKGVNFAIYSSRAESVTLALFSDDRKPLAEILLNPEVNKTGNVWHVHVLGLKAPLIWGWRLAKQKGKVFKGFMKPENLILDPYARRLATPKVWGQTEEEYHPLGLLLPQEEFDWEGDRPLELPREKLVIYEMHVRGFTKHASSKVTEPGTFHGVIEKIPHLKKLGVNAVKLMPLQEFNECEYKRFNPFSGERLLNFWGYSTVNFFSPMQRYATDSSIKEFKELVKALHKEGIEVLLDVVFNHTAEGDGSGPILSFKGIDLPIYYMIDPQHHFMNFTGCGNTVNMNHPLVRDFIRTCLHYWVSEMHVDGFRFDLAGVMMRGLKGEVLQNPPLVEELSLDPILAGTKLIAEPWDATGLYELGNFYPQTPRWSEWNDKYRDSVRRFIKGDRGEKRQFAERISGSQDIFWKKGTPQASLNFITAHDGFTLHDLVSYNSKHNSANGEDNRDGNPNNVSWNSGVEGETKDPEILALRLRRMKNFHVALMCSQGIPMVMMGNEYGHTRLGNNNPWCQDNELNYFLWDELEKQGDFFRFFSGMIAFRRRHTVFSRTTFLTDADVDWHSNEPLQPDWEGDTQFLAFTLKGEGERIFVAFNMHHEKVEMKPSAPLEGSAWHVIANTASPAGADFFEEGTGPVIGDEGILMESHSAVVLFCRG